MEFLNEVVRIAFGEGSSLGDVKLVGGGCINHTARITTSEGIYFVKWGAYDLEMFEAEAMGLELLGKNTPIHIPRVFFKGSIGSNSFLIMEWIEAGLISGRFWHNFASGLAELHRTESESYGLDKNNFIGSLPQINDKKKEWLDFFIECRLEPQLKMASDSGKVNRDLAGKFHSLFKKLPDLIPEEPASLLHGDLWSGNFLTGPEGHAAIIDPAVYFGHREMELSFSQLFGGFNPVFYQVYNEVYPLYPGFEERVEIHNLYPLLVHVNLFGTSYLTGIKRTLERFA